MTDGALTRRGFLTGAAAIGAAQLAGSRLADRRPRGAPARRRPIVDVRDFGAHGDGKTVDTKAIQRAVDAAASRRATVRFPKGRYRSGTIRLRSGVHLALEHDATLLASTRPSDFLPRERLPYPTYSDFETSDFQNALLFGDGLSGVVISGAGTIDADRHARFGPKPIALRRSHNVEVRGITIRNAPNYCVSLGGCDDVVVEDVTIRDAFADGIDPDCCRRVRITNCDIESDDDAVVLKTSLILGAPHPTEDVTVTGCRLDSPSNGFKIGTETSGDVRRVVVRDCHISGKPRRGADPQGVVLSQEGGGIAIESVDGAVVEGVKVSGITMTRADVPIFVRLGARGRGQPAPAAGAVRDVTLERIRATGARGACTISGLPGHPIERLTLDDVTVTVVGGAKRPTGPIPEADADYPQAGMFGPLPAVGIYARHATDLVLRNVRIQLSGTDSRPKLVSDDTPRLTAQPPL